MTALAVALVLCCAMVCGTVLLIRGIGSRDVADREARREIAALQREASRAVGDMSVLRADVDSLRSHVALRGAL